LIKLQIALKLYKLVVLLYNVYANGCILKTLKAHTAQVFSDRGYISLQLSV